MCKVGSSFCLCVIIVSVFFIYHNELRPIKMTQYTLTNDKKTVTFQTMSHIANPHFYKQIVGDIIEAKTNDFVLYYE